MRRTRKLFMIGIVCAGMVTAFVATSIPIIYLIVNREMVRTYIAAQAARVTGGALSYDRLDLSFLPLPHLVAREIHLFKSETFDIQARALAVYPDLLAILAGRFTLHRLTLVAPEIRIQLPSPGEKLPTAPFQCMDRSAAPPIKAIVGGAFAALSAFDPDTQLGIEQGTFILAFKNAPDIRITDIHATAANTNGDLTVHLACASNLADRLRVTAFTDIDGKRANGKITLTDVNLHRLSLYAPLPGDIVFKDTSATVQIAFTIDSPERVHARFDLKAPALTIRRKSRSADFKAVAVTGIVESQNSVLALSIDRFRTRQPALELSASARLAADDATGSTGLTLSAAARQLDLAVAGEVARAVAGDLHAIQTAFDVARTGRLTDAAYEADLTHNQTGWHLNRMAAKGHLSHGQVTIPAIDTDLEDLDGDIIYADRHVDFKKVSGRFTGATVKALDAAIDWATQSTTLSLASTDASLDLPLFYTWLTGIGALKKARDSVSVTFGSAHLTQLKVNGPLSGPGQWDVALFGIPQQLCLTSPRVPFDVGLSGVDLQADFYIGAQQWRIRRFHFTDADSRVTVSAGKTDSVIELAFSGNLEKQTLDGLLNTDLLLPGRIAGDFQASINTAAPLKSTFTGDLAGEGWHLHRLTPVPVTINRFSIHGQGTQLTIAPSEMVLGESVLIVDGRVKNPEGRPVFDLNVAADRLDEALIRRLRPSRKTGKTAEHLQSPAAPAYRGTLHLKADALTLHGFTWSPLQADLHLDGGNLHVQVTDARLCGISTVGTLDFTSQGTGLHIVPAASNASLQDSVNCLFHKPLTADARYNLSGDLRLPPAATDPVRALTGRVVFSSENGQIQYASVLMKIFSVLNITEVFTGGKSDLTENGFGYTQAHIRAEIHDGKAQLNEILLDGNSLKLTGQGSIDLATRETDITLLAAPLKTIDRIVNKVPIINYIAGGSLISVPLRITGPVSDVSVTPMSPTAVGKGVLNIMERTLKAPFKLVQDVSEFVQHEAAKEVPPTDGPPVGGR